MTFSFTRGSLLPISEHPSVRVGSRARLLSSSSHRNDSPSIVHPRPDSTGARGVHFHPRCDRTFTFFPLPPADPSTSSSSAVHKASPGLCRHRRAVRDDRGKFAIRLFARAERKIGAVTREREAEEAAVEEAEEPSVEEKEEEERTCNRRRRRRGRGEGGDGSRVGGVGGSGGRLFFYLSLTLRRERTHTGSAE